MSLRESLKRPEVMTGIGLTAIALSGLLRLFEHPSSPAVRDALDGVTGFLTGIAIATMLLALWKQRRRRA